MFSFLTSSFLASDRNDCFQIELYIHGPFPSSSHPSKFLITIQDVFSNYLLAKEANVSTAEALSRVCAEFSFSTFCAHEFKR